MLKVAQAVGNPLDLDKDAPMKPFQLRTLPTAAQPGAVLAQLLFGGIWGPSAMMARVAPVESLR